MDRKDTNPKDMIGSNKFDLTLVPAQVQGEVALAFLEGALKYGAANYRVAGVRASVYAAAALRHILRYWDGEDFDPEVVGHPDVLLHHTVKAIASLTILRDAMIQNKLTDDRPPRGKEFAPELNAMARRMIAAVENPVPRYTQTNEPAVIFAEPDPAPPQAPITLDTEPGFDPVDADNWSPHWPPLFLRWNVTKGEPVDAKDFVGGISTGHPILAPRAGDGPCYSRSIESGQAVHFEDVT